MANHSRALLRNELGVTVIIDAISKNLYRDYNGVVDVDIDWKPGEHKLQFKLTCEGVKPDESVLVTDTYTDMWYDVDKKQLEFRHDSCSIFNFIAHRLFEQIVKELGDTFEDEGCTEPKKPGWYLERNIHQWYESQTAPFDAAVDEQLECFPEHIQNLVKEGRRE